MVTIVRIKNKDDLQKAFQVRTEVFVVEQKVPADEEIDKHEETAHHYLALHKNEPAGAARWRITAEGVKLERFAVLKKYRGQGVGSALMEEMLRDIANDGKATGKKRYLHAQVQSMFLYKKFGFCAEGPMFEECGIDHYKMVKS